jgi:hypothetical protein
MNEPSADLLSDDAFLDALLDTIVPPSDAMPGAGSLSLAAALRKELANNALLARPLQAALSALASAARERDADGFAALDAEARNELVAAAMKQQPMLGMLPFVVLIAYYQHPRVREALGQRGGAPYPQGHLIEATDASLLRKLRAR